MVIVVIAIAVAIYIFGSLSKRTTNVGEIKNPILPNLSVNQNEDIPRLSTLAKNLQIPWSLVFLPDGGILFTEREGRVRLIDKDGNLKVSPIAILSEVKHIGEGGLLGITIHPEFEKNDFVYLYYTFGENGGNTLNRVARYKFDGKTLSNAKVIVDNIAGASNHNGGRIKFGPDGYLYITTGDAQNPSLSQDRNALAGKILRVTDEGSAAPSNPFGTRVYSYGHRNPQGIAWDDNGVLWETEHGSSATDELNKVEAGKNYGWPTVKGDQTEEGFTAPIIHSAVDTWAPAGAAYLGGAVYFAGLRGQALYQAVLSGSKATLRVHLKRELGRIRDVVVGPDGMLYITTSNRDGRGIPTAEDDRIIRVNPTKL